VGGRSTAWLVRDADGRREERDEPRRELRLASAYRAWQRVWCQALTQGRQRSRSPSAISSSSATTLRLVDNGAQTLARKVVPTMILQTSSLRKSPSCPPSQSFLRLGSPAAPHVLEV